jgi:putative exporter of polyketide antibiotics
MSAAAIATILVLVDCYYILPRTPSEHSTYLEMIGLRIDSLCPTLAVTAILMALFYLGPLITELIFLGIKCLYEVKYNGLLVKRESMLSPWVVVKDYVENE